MSRRLALSVVICWFGSTSAHAQDPTLPEIASELQAWRNSFATIKVVYHGWNRHDFEERFSEAKTLSTLDGHFYRKHTLIWTDTGGLRHEKEHYEQDRLVYRTVEGTDGKRPFRAASGRDEAAAKWANIELYVPSTAQGLSIKFEALSFLWLSGSGQWLGDRLAQESAQMVLERYEARDGVRCAVISHATANPSIRQYIWLDAEHGFLPRLAEVDRSKSDPRLGMSRFKVDEFQRLENGRWFPKRGALKAASDPEPGNEWVVREVQLNREFSPRDLAPPEADVGTVIGDAVTGNVRRHGSPSDAQNRPIVNSAGGQQSNNEGVSAAIPAKTWLYVTLLGIGAMLVLGGVWRQNRKH